MSKSRFALVGCGTIARKHANALHNYLEDAEIAAFEARRDKPLALKQGMMQQLLTGNIRLI